MRCPVCRREVTTLRCGHCKSRLPEPQAADLSAVMRLANKIPPGEVKQPDSTQRAGSPASEGKQTDLARRVGTMLPPHLQVERRCDGVPPEVISTVVFGSNADLMVSVEALYFRPGDRIADVTYGRGGFWSKLDLRQYKLSFSDLHTWAEFPGVENYDCRKLPYANTSMNVVAFDPPFIGRGAGWCEAQYKTGTCDLSQGEIVKLYQDGMAEAKRVLRKGGLLLVKCQDRTMGGKQIRNTEIVRQYAVGKLGLSDQDRFVFISDKPRQSPIKNGAMQRHAVHQECYLWVFRK